MRQLSLTSSLGFSCCSEVSFSKVARIVDARVRPMETIRDRLEVPTLFALVGYGLAGTKKKLNRAAPCETTNFYMQK